MENLFSWIWIVFLVLALQPIIAERVRAMRRANAIRAIERSEGSRVITMIHRQERRNLLGFPVSRFINLEDAQTIIAAIKETPKDRPIDFIVHTPGGLVLAAMQIARAIEAHPARVRVMVPVYAMSGGTLIALAANEILLGEFSVLGPIDPQLAGFPAASIVRARDSKPLSEVHDLTLVMADMSEKALAQVKRGAVELTRKRLGEERAAALAEKLAGGYWTHDYALTYDEAAALGLPVKLGLPQSVLNLMTLYPQPVQQSGVEFLPLDPNGGRGRPQGIPAPGTAR
ncbi:MULTISPECIES: ATP-dependent Clp protease proteolytic subunit [Rhodomicrobium]|uniref:SDH family Clp fold serine proteinase n=1 Tax=Rhodomicrobium TaxID=1068 RepID=UPI000B4BBE7D|nr:MULTISPECIES: ATP-dependent Clp protease proteolytic subunit [Rhodomicrobium]